MSSWSQSSPRPELLRPQRSERLTIDATLWAGLYPDGSGNYASVVIDY